MKNNKGITLTSLIIYIAVIFVVIAALMRVTTYFSNNMEDAADVSFETEFNKLNLYLLDEAKTVGNGITNISEDGTQITFTNGNTYSYNAENKAIYFNGTIKICENIENCVFEKRVAENGKNILELTIKINGIQKKVEYVLISKVNNAYLLPKGYQEVEYIESTGTQYIDTGFIPSSNTSIEMKVSNQTKTKNDKCLYCARTGIKNNTYTAFLIENSKLRVDYGNTQYFNIMETDFDIEYVYKQDKSLVYVDGELKKTLDETEFSAEYSMYLLAAHQGYSNVSCVGDFKLYYCKIWTGDTLVRDMVPCYRKSDNVAGMYDIVNDVFYTNAGTGEFLKGENKDTIIVSDDQEFINEEDYIFNLEGNVE